MSDEIKVVDDDPFLDDLDDILARVKSMNERLERLEERLAPPRRPTLTLLEGDDRG